MSLPKIGDALRQYIPTDGSVSGEGDFGAARQWPTLRCQATLRYYGGMRAVILTRFSGPDGLEVHEIPAPQPKPDEILIRVEAGGVNFADTMMASGGYPGTPPPPVIVGREFAGVVEATGERVMGYLQYGAFAEKITARRALLWPQPSAWTSQESAAFPVNFFTAWLAYWKAGLLGPFDPKAPRPRVLIHAAAGGVGTAAVQIGHLLGIETFGTSSSDEKLARLAPLGLDHAINYKRDDYEQAVLNLTNGDGVDAVLEMLGGVHTTKSLKCLADFGRCILYGTATGAIPEIDTRILYSKSASVHGLWLSVLAGNAALIQQAWDAMLPWMTEGAMRPVIGNLFPMEQVGDAYRLMLERKNFGKVVITV